MSLGVIPELETPSYADLRDRPQAEWYNDRMRSFLSGKLKNTNIEYGSREKIKSHIVGIYDKVAYKVYLELVAFMKKKKEKGKFEN